MKFTIMGCGDSLGLPMAGNHWGDCNPAEPRNNRTRASLLAQTPSTNIVIDVTPDFRAHSNTHNVARLDAALLSHYHIDHTAGLDELRSYQRAQGKKVDIYCHQPTCDDLQKRFYYMFQDGIPADYSPIQMNVIPAYGTLRIGDIGITTFLQDHGSCTSLGFRFGNFAYCPDLVVLPEDSLAALSGIEILVIDAAANWKRGHPNHAGIPQVMDWVDILKPEMTYLTVLSHRMDYNDLLEKLPPHIRPAYDGLVVET